MLARTLRFIAPVTMLGAALAAAVPAAGQTIDQQQTEIALVELGSQIGPGNGTSNGWVFQSFVPSAATAAGGQIFSQPANTNRMPGPITVELWNNQPDLPGAAMLASGTGTVETDADYYGAFWDAVSVTPGSRYWLTFSSTERLDVAGTYQKGNDPTGGGSFNYNYSSNVNDPYQGNNFGTSAFKEYSTGPAVTTTPEPSSMALLGTGLFGLVPMLRRRRKSA